MNDLVAKIIAWIKNNRLLAIVTILGPVLGGLVSISSFLNYYSIQFPLPVMNYQLRDMQKNVDNLELDYRLRARKLDQRELDEINQQIEFQKTKSVVVQALLDQKEWLEYDINKNTNRILALTRH
jgi:hypothetical protein